jgi:hypothetical protein
VRFFANCRYGRNAGRPKKGKIPSFSNSQDLPQKENIPYLESKLGDSVAQNAGRFEKMTKSKSSQKFLKLGTPKAVQT